MRAHLLSVDRRPIWLRGLTEATVKECVGLLGGDEPNVMGDSGPVDFAPLVLLCVTHTHTYASDYAYTQVYKTTWSWTCEDKQGADQVFPLVIAAALAQRMPWYLSLCNTTLGAANVGVL